jgi:hypothetical protein
MKLREIVLSLLVSLSFVSCHLHENVYVENFINPIF